MFQPKYHVSVSPTDGNGPTQGQRKTPTRVGIILHGLAGYGNDDNQLSGIGTS